MAAEAESASPVPHGGEAGGEVLSIPGRPGLHRVLGSALVVAATAAFVRFVVGLERGRAVLAEYHATYGPVPTDDRSAGDAFFDHTAPGAAELSDDLAAAMWMVYPFGEVIPVLIAMALLFGAALAAGPRTTRFLPGLIALVAIATIVVVVRSSGDIRTAIFVLE